MRRQAKHSAYSDDGDLRQICIKYNGKYFFHYLQYYNGTLNWMGDGCMMCASRIKCLKVVVSSTKIFWHILGYVCTVIYVKYKDLEDISVKIRSPDEHIMWSWVKK